MSTLYPEILALQGSICVHSENLICAMEDPRLGLKEVGFLAHIATFHGYAFTLPDLKSQPGLHRNAHKAIADRLTALGHLERVHLEGQEDVWTFPKDPPTLDLDVIDNFNDTIVIGARE